MPFNQHIFDGSYRKILDAAPDYIDTLIGSEWIKLEVHTEGPSVAWTTYEEGDNRFVVNFHKGVTELSTPALTTLWRHEVGHIALGHFARALCERPSMQQSVMERLVCTDIHINSYIKVKDLM